MFSTLHRDKRNSIIACCSAEGQYLLPPAVKIFRRRGNFQMYYFRIYSICEWQIIIYKDRYIFQIDRIIFCSKETARQHVLFWMPNYHMWIFYCLREYTDKNDDIILCFPNHTAHAFQPLDRLFLKAGETLFQRRENKVNHSLPR